MKHLSKKTVHWQGLVNMVKNPCLPQNAENCMIGRGNVSFSTRTLLHGASQLVNYTSISCFSELWPHAVCQAHTSVITQKNPLCCENLKCYNYKSFTNQNIPQEVLKSVVMKQMRQEYTNKLSYNIPIYTVTNFSYQQPKQRIKKPIVNNVNRLLLLVATTISCKSIVNMLPP